MCPIIISRFFDWLADEPIPLNRRGFPAKPKPDRPSAAELERLAVATKKPQDTPPDLGKLKALYIEAYRKRLSDTAKDSEIGCEYGIRQAFYALGGNLATIAAWAQEANEAHWEQEKRAKRPIPEDF